MVRILTLLALSAAANTCWAYPMEIISPNGGEVWQAGTTQTISWDLQYASSLVYVELYKDGEFFKKIGCDKTGTESIEWEICESYAPSGGYTIHVYTDTWPGPDEDFSDTPFSIANDTYPDINVTYPNGGEVWAAGSTQSITWQSDNTVGYIDIRLYKNGQLDRFLGQAPLADGTFTWNVCHWLDQAADYTIGVRWLTTCGNAISEDISDAPFSITDSATKPTLAITYPTGGQIFNTDSVQTITWQATNPVGNVEIWLTNSMITSNGTIFEPLGTAPMADQSFDWTIKPCLASRDDYSILLHWEDGGTSIQDTSTIGFEVVNSYTPDLTVTTPNASTSIVTAGSTLPITWQSTTTYGMVDIQLVNDQEVAITSLGQVPISDGSFNWNICPATPTDNYRIRLFMPACTVTADSDYFAIDGTAPEALYFTNLPITEPWPAGSSQTVTWNSNNLTGFVDLYLPDNADTHWAKVSVPVTDGSYTWTIPSSLTPGDDYRMDIRSYECGTIASYDFAPITISEPVSLAGDYDHDGDLDLMDLALFQACSTGPGHALLTIPCDVFDFEPDADIDANDLSTMLNELTGPVTE